MTRSLLTAAALSAALLAGCATTDPVASDGDLVDRVRQELAADPQLSGSQVTVTERDGTIVIGGFARSIEEIDAIREAIEGVDGVAGVENNVILQTDG